MIRLGQFSDTHVAAEKPRTSARLAAAVEFFRRCEGLAGVVCTGDRTASGTAEEQAEFERLVAPLPVVAVRGNHDARSGEPSEPPRVVDLGEARLIALDSSIPTFDDGLVGRRQLAWLDAELARDPRPTLLALHHPPALLRTMTDNWPLQDAEDFGTVVSGHAHVAGILAGHAHSATVTTFAGVPLVVCPAIVNHVLLPEEGSGLSDAWPPVVAVHYLDDGRLITHFRTVA